MNVTVVSFLILYFLVVLGIGVWAMRKGAGDNLEGYMLGGRRLGALVTALTLQSTSMSGYMFLGAGALGFSEGYWALWYVVGDVGGGVINLSVLGRRMRKLSALTGSLTPIEYLDKRYESPAIRLFAGVLTVFLLGAYVLAQFIAGGKGMALVTGMPYWAALLGAVGLILAYTYMGGYLAVAYTDFFQAIVMLVGVLWILAAALANVGGFAAANRAIGEVEPTLLSVWGRDLGYQGQWGMVLGAVLIFSVGYMGWPHVVMRHMAMRDPSTARWAGAYATVWNMLFVPTPYLVGLLAVLIVPDLADPEMAIFQVAQKLLPSAAVGVVMAAVMAAIMSTADSLLLQTGSIAARDLYERFVRPDASEREMVWVSRLLVLAIGAGGYFIALVEPPTVFGIVVFVTSVLGSAFLPAYVCAVWWKRANGPGALASMVTGAVVAFLWQLGELDAATGMHAMLVGLVASTATIVGVSLATEKSAPLSEEILAKLDEAARLD